MENLLAQLTDAGIRVKVVDGRLKLRKEDGKIPAELLEAVKTHKEALIVKLQHTPQRNASAKIVDDRAYYELSLFQHELWLNSQRFDGPIYNQVRPFLLEGALDFGALEKALADLLDRYEILRTTFHLIDEEVYQRVNDRNELYADALLQHRVLPTQEGSYEAALEMLREMGDRTFDLSKGPLIEFTLIEFEPQRYLFVQQSHHIIMDGWSSQIIMQDIVEAYLAYSSGQTPTTKALDFQYLDFAAAQQRKIRQDGLDQHRDYWMNYLEGDIGPLPIPKDFTRPATKSFHGANSLRRLDAKLSQQIKDYCREQNITQFIFFQALLKTLLYRYTGQQDIIIGSVFAGRESVELERQVGSFANILPLRTQFENGQSFADLVAAIKSDTFDIYQHQFYPFTQILKDLELDFDRSHSPLFDVMLIVQNFMREEQEGQAMDSLSVKPLEFELTTNTLDLYFIVNENAEGQIGIDLGYNPDLFKAERMERIQDHLAELATTLIVDDQQQLAKVDFMSPAERTELIYTFNETSIGEPPYDTILEMFAEMVETYPEQKALTWRDRNYTYTELDQATDQLALALRDEWEIEPGDFVGVLTGRNHYTILSMIAIMKLGAIHLPLEEDLPEQRIESMLALVSAKLVISTADLANKAAAHRAILQIDQMDEKTRPGTLDYQVTANDPAYIIFTSGSTGVPKPIVAKHEGLVNNIYDYAPKLGIRPEDNYLQFFATGFDGFFFDIFPLFCGATMVMADKAIINDREVFLKYLEDQEVTMMATTPSYLDVLERPEFPGIHTLISAGEEVDPDNARYYATNKKFFNLYGPAEVTIIATLYQVEAKREYTTSIPIGRPCANKELYIVDENLNLMPIGFPGEIAISGAGIVDGYWNDEALSAKKFVPNPFVPGQKLYRTGDMGQWQADGTMLFLGRIDSQVKINGYRVEIGEIEKTMLRPSAVQKALILVDKRGKNKELIGFYETSSDEQDWSVLDMRQYLMETIPTYMVPNRLLELKEWPVSHTGKVDRKKLLAFAEEQGQVDHYIAPQNELQEKLQSIWMNFLQREKIGIYDNFFEIGGDSLLAIRVSSAIRSELARDLSVRDFFTYPNIASMSACLAEQTQQEAQAPIERVDREERIPLSFAQERLWVIDQMSGSLEYHMSTVLGLRGKLREDWLEEALRALVEQHEVLRTVFLTDEDGIAYQKVNRPDQWGLFYLDIRQLNYDTVEERLIPAILNQPFDLSKDYALRAHLLQVKDEEYRLILVVHHIASDGWSQSILVEDLMKHYQCLEQGKRIAIEPSRLQYADYAYWQRKNITEEKLAEKMDWWEASLKGIEPLRLPTDFPRPSVQSHEGDRVYLNLKPQLRDQLKALARNTDSSLFMVLLSAVKVLLHRYSNQDSICVGTSLANRNTAAEEAMVGFFINTLALRSDLGDQPSFRELLGRVRENTLEAFKHQEVPFEKVVERVEKKRSLSQSPIFQVEFVLQNLPEISELELGELEVFSDSIPHQTSQFDLSISMFENDNGIAVGLTYCTALFTAKRMERMAQHLSNLLEAIVSQPDQNITQLNLLSPTEKQLLEEFNATDVDYPRDANFIDLFTAQVAKNPTAIAVEQATKKLSYKELDQQANQWAHRLIRAGIQKEDIVGVCMDRSIPMLVSILAIMKCGAAYLPIDPEYPQKRIDYILEDSAAKVIITSNAHRQLLTEDANREVMVWENEMILLPLESSKAPAIEIPVDNLAYLIYTSGSTGRPKGVMIEHRGMVNHLFAKINELRIDDSSKMLQNASQSFDISIWQFLVALVQGGTTVVFSQDLVMDPARFLNQIAEQGLTHVEVVPSYLRVLLEEEAHLEIDFPDLQFLLVTGETLPKPLTKAWFERFPRITMVNAYGPTEASDDITHCHLNAEPEEAQVPIGHVLQNLKIYVLNDQLELCPIGVPGEICVTGIGVGRGYLNRPELTAEKFIDNPFIPGERIYRTGDLGYWYPNGQLAFMGRKDYQVKVRGHRIELGEIEASLDQVPGVAQSIVLVHETEDGLKKLIAYFVREAEDEHGKEAIQRELQNRLPDYMLPSLWIELEEFPLTPNGKIDRKALPSPNFDQQGGEGDAPTNETETQLLQLWKELLNRENIGIHDNFFELGGDSIITIQVASRAKRLGYFIQPKDIFLHQDIASLANAIDREVAPELQTEQGVLVGDALLLPIQQHFLATDTEARWHYNQSVLLEVDKQFGPQDIQTVVDYLTERHDALRFRYQREAGSWQQEYQAKIEALKVVDFSDTSRERLPEAIEATCAQAQTELDPSAGRTCQFRWMETPQGEEKHRLLIVVHHLAIDGISWRIILDDLENALANMAAGENLNQEDKGSSYRQWGAMLRQQAQTERMTRQLAYWKKAATPAPSIPVDQEAGPGTFGSMQQVSSGLDYLTTEALLQQAHQAYSTEINDLLLAALARTINNWSGESRLVVGLEGHGREALSSSHDINETVGWFTSLYPLNLEVNGSMDEAALIKSIKEQIREIPDKGVGFGVLRFAHPDAEYRNALANAHWDIEFNYLGQIDNAVNNYRWIKAAEEDKGSPISADYPIAEKILINASIVGGQLSLGWTFSTKNYKASTIERLADNYIATLTQLIQHCQEQEGRRFTPSDLGLKGALDYRELDQLNDYLAEKELDGDEILKF